MNIVDKTYGSTVKRVAYACLMIMLCSSAYSQVTLSLAQQAGIAYTLQDLSTISILNSGTQRYNGCYIEITGDNLSSGQSFTIRTSAFVVQSGITTPGYAAVVGSTVIRPSDDYFALEQQGKFPSGKYNLCMTLYTSQGADLAKECRALNILEDATFILISPVDEQLLHTFTPTLVWQPYTHIGDNIVTYNIHIAELNEGQSYGDAMGMNPPLVYEKDLSTSIYNYPSSAIALEEDKKYVWQVEVMAGGQRISYSEIWMFQYKKNKVNPPVKKPKVNNEQYPHLSKIISSAVYQYSDKIYFMYDNYANDSLLDYSIIKTGAPRPMKLEDKKEVVLTAFNNYLAIPVSEQLKKEAKDASFVLEIHNSRHEKWALKFSVKQQKRK